MLKLVLNVLRLHRGFLALFGLAYPVYMGYFGARMNSQRAFLVLAAFVFTILPLSVMAREDRFKAAAFWLCLPVTRRDHVLSRYLLGWALMIPLFAAMIAVVFIMPGGKATASSLLAPPMLLQALAYMTLAFAGLMPLLVRFGMTGLLVFLIGLQVLGIAAMLVSRDSVRLIKAAIGAVGRAIASAESSFGLPGAVLAAVAVLFALNALSFAASMALFKRKEF